MARFRNFPLRLLIVFASAAATTPGCAPKTKPADVLEPSFAGRHGPACDSAVSAAFAVLNAESGCASDDECVLLSVPQLPGPCRKAAHRGWEKNPRWSETEARLREACPAVQPECTGVAVPKCHERRCVVVF
jgi:hypothetical protein